MLDYPEAVVRLTLWCIVVGLYPTLLMTLIGVLWFPSRAITQMHQALNDRLDDAISHLTDSPHRYPKRGLKERRWRCKNSMSFASRTMPTGEPRAHGGKAAWQR